MHVNILNQFLLQVWPLCKHNPDSLADGADNHEERIQNVLQPSARMRGFFNACYWSSGPSDDVDSTETLDFRLAHPLCVVRGVALQPFKAYFQSVRLATCSLGQPHCFALLSNDSYLTML